MKIINLGRGQGKTTRLLYASEFNDAPILCATDAHKKCLIEKAKGYGLEIPEPITVNDIVSGKVRGSKITDKDVLVDEAPFVLQYLLRGLGMNGEVKAITLSEKYNLE